jgi:hypothetical protein
MRLYIVSFLVLLLNCSVAVGQLKLMPIQKATPKARKLNATKIENDTINLPFWDDFSFSPDNLPADSLWEDSDGIYVGNGLGLNPPSIGVASFDGVSSTGGAYSGTSTSKTDSLKSSPIDLSSLTVASNVYLSFYYQFAGNGEAPELTDSIRVEFKNNENNWVSVWPNGAVLNNTKEFVQVLIKVDDPSFFHDHFQFKFQSFGKPKGVYDVWNLDYVYMNSGRSAIDDNYPDRTISTPLTSIFNGFTAIPAKHYRAALHNMIPSYTVTSVDNPNDGAQPYRNYFETSLISWSDSIENITATPVVFGGTRSLNSPTIITERMDSLFDKMSIPEGMDSIFINLKTYIDASDNKLPNPGDPNNSGDYDLKYSPIDFRINDTIRNSYVLKDYYAYDDGTAEVAAGLNFSGNRLAIKFPITPTVTDTLVAVDMYFPLAQNDPNGRSVDITIWGISNDKPNNVLYSETVTLLRDIVPNKFIRYQLRTAVALQDTFFLGYRQNNEGELGLGFDRNNNSNTKYYFNVGSEWQQKPTTELQGSFMIRPVFGNTIPYDPITSVEDDKMNSIKIFPNPSSGLFTIEGEFDEFKVYNLHGQVVVTGQNSGDNRSSLNLADQPRGLYFARIVTGKFTKTIKLIKE